jgi:hypothetical protein
MKSKMAKKQLPFTKKKLEQIVERYPTPFHKSGNYTRLFYNTSIN